MSSDVKSEKATLRASSRQRQQPTSDIDELHRRLDSDPRFNPPPPSPWKRVALLAFVLAILWLALSLRMNAKRTQPQVVHAQRYSNEHKFRPAASPIVTEYLPDGRKRVRGAQPTFRY